MDWINDFLKGVFKTVGTMDWATIQPFNLQFHSLFSKEWVEWLSMLQTKSKEKGVSARQLGLGVSPATDAFDQLFFTLLDLKTAKISKEKRLQIAEFLKEMGLYWLKEDYFSLEGKHIVHTPEQIKQLLTNSPFQKANPEIAKLLGKLHSAAYHLTNGLYSDLYMGHSHANHGPYDTSSKFGIGSFLVIKEFINLKPLELWPDAKTILHDKIRIYAVYKNVHFKTDFISCHSFYEGDTINGLVAWAVEADNKFVTDKDELEKIRVNFEKNSVEKWNRLISMDFETLKHQGVRMRCYTLSGVCKLLGINWEPPKEMLDAVKNKPFATEEFWQAKDKESKEDHWRKLLDPRIDYFV